MEREPSNDQKQESLLRQLYLERDLWLPTHQRAERANHLNADLNRQERRTMRRIDILLDGLIEVGFISEPVETTVQ